MLRVIILAAGQGTRLRPYTDCKPKCMVELAGKPLLHRQMEVIRAAGIERITLVGGYYSDRIDPAGAELVLNPRYAETNMVSTLFCAENDMKENVDLLIAYGDIVYEKKVLNSLLSTDAPVVISVDRQWQKLWERRMENPLLDAETLKLDDGNRVVEVGKRPANLTEIQGQYMGLIKVRGDFVQSFKEFWYKLDQKAIYDGKSYDNMYMTSFLQQIIDAGVEVRAAFTDKGWIEVDTAKDLELYEELARDGVLQEFVRL